MSGYQESDAEVLLGILIPTRNRLRELQLTLENLKESIEADGEILNISILIGDNASEDGTGEFLKNSNYSYYINEKNLGITQNIIKGISLLRCKYVWIFGDDDLIPETAILNIVGILKEGRTSHLWLPSLSFMESKELDLKKRTVIEKLYKLPNRTFFEEYDRDSGFITSNIYRKEILNKGIEYLIRSGLKDTNNYFIRAVSYYIVCNEGTCKLEGLNVFKRVGNGSSFTKTPREMLKTFMLDVNELMPIIRKIDINVYKIQKEKARSNFIMHIIVVYTIEEWRKILQREYVLYRSPFVLLMLLLGRRGVDFTYRLYKRLRGSPVPSVLMQNINRYED